MASGKGKDEIPAGWFDPAALTVEQAARLLGVKATTIRRHIEDGAPTTPDGRINLLHYTAWLVREVAGGEE